MDTNTIIELFEELRKQLTSLSRRIDDRNISAPAPVTTDDKIARLLETAQFTIEMQVGRDIFKADVMREPVAFNTPTKSC